MLEITETRPSFSKKRLFMIILLLFVGAASFLLILSNQQNNDGLAAFNKSVLDSVVSHRAPQLTTVMQIITNITSPLIFAGVIFIGSAIWAWRKADLWRPMLLLAAMGATLAITAFIKNITKHGRPPTSSMIPPLELDYSFPSGHTIGIAVFLLVITYFVWSRKMTIDRFMTCLVITIIGIAAVAASRLYLGYHWLTDVSASVALAFIIVSLVMIIDTIKQKIKPTKVI